ncbi:hypothetical protein LCGC14_0318110 [marine sediment metagenome]|uniref:Uncharacterized protein n=1 Tax=marine sediment metagenome TaxID=412755 RepID=A0A0F9U2K7_9ZZZZ
MAKKRKKRKERDGDELIQKVRGVAMLQDQLFGVPDPYDGPEQEERKDKELMAFMNIFHPDKAPKNMYEARKMRK